MKGIKIKPFASTGLPRMKSDSSFTLEALYPSWLTNVVNKLTIALLVAVNSKLPQDKEAVG